MTPSAIPSLLNKLDEGYDLVCGWRKERQDTLLTRCVPSVIANWIIGKVTGVPIHDNGCSLKAYRAEMIKQVPLYGEMHRFIPAMSTVTGARFGLFGKLISFANAKQIKDYTVKTVLNANRQ